MEINLHNYESYLLDFSEGNLKEELVVELEVFLIRHPELHTSLPDDPGLFLKNEVYTYNEKNSLKKSENDLITDTMFVAYIEEQMPVKECLHLEKSCSMNSGLSHQLKLYRSTLLKPDLSIRYAHKNQLKRKPKIIWFDFAVKYYAAAACVILLFGAWIFWTHQIKDESVSKITAVSPIPFKGSVQQTKTSSQNQTNNSFSAGISLASKNGIHPSLAKGKRLQPTTQVTVVPETNTASSGILNPDSAARTPLIAQNQLVFHTPETTTVVEVLTESDDDAEGTSTVPKKGLWAVASRALKNLNQAGVKSVDGEESEAKNKNGYVLTLGGICITHKPANL
ncbi:MAG: hypothetical protein K0R26_1503 [Bacteroidota bacterium]|jgi:hypothetical protein|nr:hypothetical protein [Bacteroidota bacterium]